MSDASFDSHKIKDLISGHMSGPSPTCEERQIASSEEWGLLKTTAVTWQGWDHTAHKIPPPEYWKNYRIEVKAGDVLVTKAGPRHRVGVVVYVDKPPPRLMVSGKMIGLRPDPTKVDSRVLAAALSQHEPQRFLDSRTTGMADSQLNFTNDLLLNTVVKLPPKSEQTKIAEILSTTDWAIEQTEALIAKQQHIKTGLMQDFLARGIDEHGKLRSERTHLFKDSPLGRIPMEWEVSRLESIGTWASGGTPSKANASYWGDKIPWVCPKDMKTFDIAATIERLTQAGVQHGSRVMPAKTVFIVVRGMILAHTFPVCIASQPMSFNQDVKAIIAKSNIEGRFLAYWLASQENNFLRITTTATHGTKRFDMKEMFDVMMPVPKKEEQTRIVTRLDTTEAQIDSNKKMAAKLRALKTALMHDLLTGKKRVTLLLESKLKREKMYAQR
jgi:type I restriction enzyme S subunit